MKKRRISGKIIHEWYSCGDCTFIILCNRMRIEKIWKNDSFDLWNTGRNIFWYFHIPLRKWWKKDFTLKKNCLWSCDNYFWKKIILVFKDFPGRRRAKCTKLGRCYFQQYFCKKKFIIFSQEFCPINQLFWNPFS